MIQVKINNFHHHSVSGEIDNSFIGLKIKGNDVHFYYPESYHFECVNGEYDLQSIINLLRTISLGKTHSKDHNVTFNSHREDNDFAIYSYLWLIRDWLNNGFYINREKNFKTNQKGKVNWKRTFNQQPIISNGNIIYNNVVVEVKSEIDLLLLEIHKYCIKKSIEYIGWLFNLTAKGINCRKLNDSLKKVYIRTLNIELERTFDDIKKMRLSHMKSVLIGLDVNNEEKDFVYGVDSYYYIFERMVDYIFGTEKDLTKFNPKATWKLFKPEAKEKDASKLRPDTILIKDNIAYIIDSKFYRFGSSGDINDLPETTSIQKQVTYGEYLSKINENKTINVDKILNAFILPYDKTREKFKSNENIQYIGYAKTEWKNNLEEHQFVYAFLIDLYHVVEVWNNSNHDEDISNLIQEINIAIQQNSDH